MPYTVNQDTILFETTASADPSDTVASWAGPIWLQGVTQGQPPELQYWHASEYLRVASVNSTEEYLAAFNDNAIAIDIKGLFQPGSSTDSCALSCPQPPIAGVAERPSELRMTVSQLVLNESRISLRLTLPARTKVQVSVYDIAGRRRAKLVDRELPEGDTTLSWDGLDLAGSRVPSGVYFVRLVSGAGSKMSKLVMLR